MQGETVREKRFRRRANYHFASNARKLPESHLPFVTPARLVKDGFEKINGGYYRKDFSGVMELRFLLKRRAGKFYDWIMHTDNFSKMNMELRTLHRRIERETRRLRKLMKAEVRQVLRKGGRPGEFLKQLAADAQPVRREVTDFRMRYKDFLEIVDEVHAQGPYYQTRSFCFDACTTTHELALFTEFITLYMQVFADLKVSRSGRALSAGEVKEAIIAYYVYCAAIKKIRALWVKEMSLKDIHDEFSTISEQLLEDMTLESGSRGWHYRACDIALDLASDHSNTTVGNLRQVLHADRVYARQLREQVGGIKDIEKVLSHSARVPRLWPLGPKRQQEEQANQIIRSVLKGPLPD